MNYKYYGEDQIDRFIREKFFTDFAYQGLLIEVGAGPTEFYSVSKHFRDSGWRCIGFDPNPKFYQQHRDLGHEIYQLALSNFVGSSNFTIVDTEHWKKEHEGISYSALSVRYPCPHKNRTEITVNVDKLDNILNKLCIKFFDILIVDVEGWELEVIKGLDTTKIRPKLIVLENWLHLSDYETYMSSIGYKLSYKLEHNYIFIPV